MPNCVMPNDLVEARVIELREDPNLLGDRTDLAYLRAIRQLFQDIYVWAGRSADGRHRRRTSLSARRAASVGAAGVMAARSTSSTGSERSASDLAGQVAHTG